MKLMHPSKTVGNLGVVFDENFNFRTHINNVCKLSCTITSATCVESENIWTWTKPSAWRLLLCPVGLTTATPCCMVSQLGTCSSSRECRTVLPGWSPGLVALHLVPPPLRHSLHWLPMSFRIQFKILTLTYNTLSSGKPSYLANLIRLGTPNRNLRFNKKTLSYLLLSARLRPELEFSVFVYLNSLWNKLPKSIRSSESLTCFRQRLKTYLFDLAYPP